MVNDVEWLKSVQDQRARQQCSTCRDKQFVRLQELVAVIVRAKAKHITVSMVHERMCEIDKTFAVRVSCDALRHHFAKGHSPEWRKR